MKFHILGEITYNKKIRTEFYHLKVRVPEICSCAKPGQFVHIRCQNTLTPLLRRPMSIFNINNDVLEIIYRMRGQGTQILATRKRGESLDIIGPLGHGFNFENKSHAILVGGGMGLVPLYYLAKKFTKKKQSYEIFMGARFEKELFTYKFFRKLISNKFIKIATDDGSIGFKGRVPELLENHIKSITNSISSISPFEKGGLKGDFQIKIYSCGPEPMLKAMQALAQKYNLDCEISLEEYMGCGVGACLSCVCKSTNNEYKRVCQEGPVFNANDVVLE
ncbi:dihydroorotate dehydrogenase electron transfer subunit [Candidatus Poribacteria bacterium]|nr:dihydroorotate dehydrogenase electron transfer subunit [Candidatus Poribacteria bacterium]